MKNLFTGLQTRVKDNLLEQLARPTNLLLLSDIFLNRATFIIEISEQNNQRLFNDMLTLIRKHTLIKGTNRFKVHRSPQKSEDVISPGNGVYIFNINSLPFYAKIEEYLITGSSGSIYTRKIFIRGMNASRGILNKAIHDSYPEDIFLPYVFKDNAIVGLVEQRYGHQRQFIDKGLYNQADVAINRMVNDKDYYIDNDLPHKETFLLYGPPGTGKSTIVRHFASKYALNIYITNPREAVSNMAPLIDKPSIILLEDIDAYEELLDPQYHTSTTSEKYDYSEFINFLDGVVPLKNVIVFMTTNFKEKLLESVIRTGRVDTKLKMDRIGTEEIIKYAGWSNNDDRAEYIRTVDPNIINVAVLKKLTLCSNTEECVSVIEQLQQED